LQLQLNCIGDKSRKRALHYHWHSMIVQLHFLLLSHCSWYTTDCNWSTRQLLLRASTRTLLAQ